MSAQHFSCAAARGLRRRSFPFWVAQGCHEPARRRRDDDIQDDLPVLDTSYKNIIFCDNLPVVPPEKFDKLASVVRKIFGQIGNIREGARRAAPPASIF